MFDRTRDDTRIESETDLARLCRQYDSLLTEGRSLSDEAARELTGLAGVYDLDIDRPH